MIKRYCNVFILSILHCLNRVSQMAVTTDSGNICVVWCLFYFFVNVNMLPYATGHL